MMGANFDETWVDRPAFLLFGDQSLNSHAFLAEIFRQDRQGELAKAFLRQAGHAVKTLIERLPVLERKRLPEFRTLQQLNERYRDWKYPHSGVDAALLSISQLVHYLE
jgi:hypothetical protein